MAAEVGAMSAMVTGSDTRGRSGGRRAASSVRALVAAVVAVLAILLGAIAVSQLSMSRSTPPVNGGGPEEALPSPEIAGRVSLEEALKARRSIRSFSTAALSQAEIGQLLWAAQGTTDADGHRTAPSAGALYPLELDVVSAGGLARYVPDGHRLVRRGTTDPRAALKAAALDQAAVGEAPLVIVISGVVERTAAKYGAVRAERYVTIEAGHAAQNILLEAVSLGLGAVPIGAFDDAQVRRVLALAEGEAPLYLIAVGHPRP